MYALSFSNQSKGFLNYLLRNFDINKDGIISMGEALQVTELLDIEDSYGVKLENIELFRNVTAISCGASCYALGQLDLSALHQLRSFTGMADEIDVSGCPELEVLVTTEVSKLDLSHNPKLRELDVGFSDSLRLDVRHNPLLERIDWYSLANDEVDLSGLSQLRYVDGHESRIKRLLVRDCSALEWLRCAGGRSLEVLDVRGCTNLCEIDVNENNLTSLDLSETPHLQRLNLFFNRIAALDLIACPELDWFYCAGNRMETLNVQGCRSLRWVECTSNSFEELDFSGCPALDSLDCSDCKPLRSLKVKGCSRLRYLHCSDGPRRLDLSGNPALEEFWCQQSLEEIDLSHNPVLREVNVSGSETITFLDLTQNPLLESVWGLYCPNLEAVYLSNAAFFSVDPSTKVYVNGERVF
jgi:Leucine-rich repeat (LRR) protein